MLDCNKKINKNTTNHYHNVLHPKVDLDYDKLAQAIVKAQQEVEEQKEKKHQDELVEHTTEKIKLFSVIKAVLTNKKDTEGRMLTGALTLVLSFVFRMIATIGWLFDLLLFGLSCWHFINDSWTPWTKVVSNIFLIILLIAITIFIFFLGLIMWGAANDIDRENDRNYVVAVFSGVVSLVTLIVTIVQIFFRGVI